MEECCSFIYILTNSRHSVFYTGVTTNIIKRIWEHKNHVVEGFTKRYNTGVLVYYEIFYDVQDAIASVVIYGLPNTQAIMGFHQAGGGPNA